MGVSIQNYSVQQKFVCVYNHRIQKMNNPRRFGCQYYQSTDQLILDVRSSGTALSHQHDLAY